MEKKQLYTVFWRSRILYLLFSFCYLPLACFHAHLSFFNLPLYLPQKFVPVEKKNQEAVTTNRSGTFPTTPALGYSRQQSKFRLTWSHTTYTVSSKIAAEQVLMLRPPTARWNNFPLPLLPCLAEMLHALEIMFHHLGQSRAQLKMTVANSLFTTFLISSRYVVYRPFKTTLPCSGHETVRASS